MQCIPPIGQSNWSCSIWNFFTISDSSVQNEATNSSDDFELCKKGETLRNHALKGGRNAGAYYKIGKVRTFEECIDLCCSNEDCSLALFVKRNCYSVECESARLCKPIRVHRAIKPSIFRRYRGRFGKNSYVLNAWNRRIYIMSSLLNGFQLEIRTESISVFAFQ